MKKHPTTYTLYSFSKKEVCKSLKKKSTSRPTTRERKRSFTRKKAKSNLQYRQGTCNSQARNSEASEARNRCLRKGYFLPNYYSKDDEMCASFGMGFSKYFTMVPVAHQQLFLKYFYLSAKQNLFDDPLSGLILSRLLRLERGFLMSYFLILDRNDFRNWTVICKAFDEIKPIKLRVYRKVDYYRIFSTSNNDPVTGLSKYDLVYILLCLLEKQHEDFEPLTVSKEYPCIIEYFSLHLDYTCATKTIE